MLMRECLWISRERNFLLHKSNIVFISLHTNFFFRFSFTYTFHYQRKKSSLVCCFSFLLFFLPNLAALKHSQNLSTGVSHSTSDRGTVKTDNYFTFNFLFLLKVFPSSSLSFSILIRRIIEWWKLKLKKLPSEVDNIKNNFKWKKH